MYKTRKWKPDDEWNRYSTLRITVIIKDAARIESLKGNERD